MRSLLVALLSASLVTAPLTAVSAQGAAPLSLSSARAGPAMQSAQRMEGDNTWLYIGLGAVALILFFILVLDDDDDEDVESP